MSLPIAQPFPLFADRNGSPLDNGYIYVGTVNTNPETSPIQAYWDSALTIPAAQPLRTVNGYIVRNGSPASVYINADSFSCTVKDRGRALVIYSPSVASSSLASVNAAAASAAAAALSASSAQSYATQAANSAASIPSTAQLEDYLAKIRVPIGMVMPFADDVVPYGYLECNGAAISRTSYSDLFAVIGTTFGVGDGSTTFNVPDLRAYFVRGWDHGRGVDTARVFGSNQAQSTGISQIQTDTGNGSDAPATVTVPQDGTNSSYFTTGTSASPVNGQKMRVSNPADQRPANVALMYCIKAFDAALTQTPPQVTVTESGTTRTLALVDQSKYIRCTSGSAVTITVPTNASVPFPVDAEISVVRAGSGSVTFSAAGGVTINAAGLSITAQYRAVTIKKVATDTWDLIGAV